MEQSELKPCPFCGSTNLFTKQRSGLFSIECNECVAEGPPNRVGVHAAIAAWNTRVPDPAVATLGRKISDEEWISVEDRLPALNLNWSDGADEVIGEYARVLIFAPDGNGVRSGSYDKFLGAPHGSWTDCDGSIAGNVTHWRPLSSPPEARVADLSRKPNPPAPAQEGTDQ